MARRWIRHWVVCVQLLGVAGWASGQGPTVPSGSADATGSVRKGLLGPAPGDPGRIVGEPGDSPGIFGASPGANTPRARRDIVNPSRPEVAAPLEEPIAPARPGPAAPLPALGLLTIPRDTPADEAPEGLALDDAIARLLRDNPTLRAQRFELTIARADVLTAGLRNNPLLYLDSQGIPYGRYTQGRPGSVQYDINVTHPIDLSGKRKARVDAASRAVAVVEAQFADAARIAIDGLYTVYCDMLAARESVRYYQASRDGQAETLAIAQQQMEEGVPSRTPNSLLQLGSQLAETEIGLRKAKDDLQDSKDRLGVLLGCSTAEDSPFEFRGSLSSRAYRPPETTAELVRMALECRPDLAAYRLGIRRADSEIRLARANRYEDVYLLGQPYTYRTRSPGDLGGSTSWAMGLTIPLPAYNRNQGNIKRAEANAVQSRFDLSAREQAVVYDVKNRAGDVELTGQAVEDYCAKIVRDARKLLDTAEGDFRRKTIELDTLLAARGRYNEVARRYLDALIQHRRAMLALNTAVGRRVLP